MSNLLDLDDFDEPNDPSSSSQNIPTKNAIYPSSNSITRLPTFSNNANRNTSVRDNTNLPQIQWQPHLNKDSSLFKRPFSAESSVEGSKKQKSILPTSNHMVIDLTDKDEDEDDEIELQSSNHQLRSFMEKMKMKQQPNPPAHQLAQQLVQQPAHQSTNWSANLPASQPTNRPANQASTIEKLNMYNSHSESDDDDEIIITDIRTKEPKEIEPLTTQISANRLSPNLQNGFNAQSMNINGNNNDKFFKDLQQKKQKFLEIRQKQLNNQYSQNLQAQQQPHQLQLQQQQLQKQLQQQQLINQRQNSLAKKLKLEDSPSSSLLSRRDNSAILPLKRLPTKYQVNIPENVVFNYEIEPILKKSISQKDVDEEQKIMNFPEQLKAVVIRNENMTLMHGLVYRINNVRELKLKLEIVMSNAIKIRTVVVDKSIRAKGIKDALIRYNQIIYYFDKVLKSLRGYLTEINSLVENLGRLKRELMTRCKRVEIARITFMQAPYYTDLSRIGYTKIDKFNYTVYEQRLLMETVVEMSKLSVENSTECMKYLRKLKNLPPRLPQIIAPPPTLTNQQRNNSDEYRKMKLMIEQNMNNNLINTNDVAGSMINLFDQNRIEINSDDEISILPNPNGGTGGGGYNNIYTTNNDEAESIESLMNAIKATEVSKEGLANTPADMNISLLKHQRIGLSWMLKMEESKNKGGILADDMGLGKTVQSMSIMVANRSKDENCKTNLIIGPVSLLPQWQQELDMKIKDNAKFTTYLFHSTNKVKSFNDLKKFDVVLISYNTLASEWKKHNASAISQLGKKVPKNAIEKNYKSPFFTSNAMFYRITLDEAQNIKNKATIASKSCAALNGIYRWCLSGTPIQNRIEELYPLIRFLDIGPYNDEQKFTHKISNPIKNKSQKGHATVHALLSAILLRRTKDSELDGKPILSLPEKHIVKEKVEMTLQEKEFYDELESKSKNAAEKMMNSKNKKMYSSILVLLLRMRQACDHYYLVKMGEDGDRASRLARFTKGFEAIKEYQDYVIDRIDKERDVGFTCQMCEEDLAETEILLLSKCGHSLCKDCHEQFFEENVETIWGGERSAKCKICHVPNLESMSVDLELYDAVMDEHLNWKEIKIKFDLTSKASDKHWRRDMIKKFIQDDNGKLMISAKIAKCLELVHEILDKTSDEKIIIFSQFIGFFDIIQILLRDHNIEFLRYDGSMDMESKNNCISEFYKNSTKRVLLLSLKAGNVGLTLTCANHVILLEPFWNPYVEKQAQDRVHRISQTREVFIHRILIEKTVEDRIMELQEEKEKMVESALDPNARSTIGKLSRRELGFLFGLNGLANLEDDPFNG